MMTPSGKSQCLSVTNAIDNVQSNYVLNTEYTMRHLANIPEIPFYCKY